MDKTLKFMRDAARVTRYHTKSVIHRQNLAEHSHGVAMLCWWITGGKASAALLGAALVHDLAEEKYGDIPSPTKRELPDYPERPFRAAYAELETKLLGVHEMIMNLDPEEQWVLDVADNMEGLLYCAEERRMGNTTLGGVFLNYYDYLTELYNAAHDISGVSVTWSYRRRIRAALDLYGKEEASA